MTDVLHKFLKDVIHVFRLKIKLICMYVFYLLNNFILFLMRKEDFPSNTMLQIRLFMDTLKHHRTINGQPENTLPCYILYISSILLNSKTKIETTL